MKSPMIAKLQHNGLLVICLLLFPAISAFAAGQQEIVCIGCHGKLAGKYAEPVRLWQGSIHAENGIACNGCHGGDPKDAANAMSPARGFLGAPKGKDIPAFCGRCHIGVMNDYLSSAHGRALGKGGPTCVTCHGNHQVVKASLELINETSCTRCHSFEKARLIRDAMQQTEGMIVAIDQRINGFKHEGVDVEQMEKGLYAVRNRFHTLSHNVDLEKVRKESVLINAELTKLTASLQRIEDERRQRKMVGIFAVAGALVAALFLRLFRQTYD